MFCPKCGNKVQDTWNYCLNCGCSLEDKIENYEDLEINKKESKHIFSWFVCIIYVIAFFTNTPFSFRNIINILCALIACPIFIKFMKEKANIDIKPNIQVAIFLILIVILNIYTNILSLENNSTSDNIEVENSIDVEIPDFSTMEKQDIISWCKKNNITYKFEEEFSDSIEKGKFIKQSVSENSIIKIVYSLGKAPTLGEKNALNKAYSYLNFTAFSKKGLIEQLEFEGFALEEAEYAVDNCGADWKEQAAKKAKQYLSYMSFSRSGLIEQLEFEGFTKEEAEYGVTSVGY